MLKLVSRYQRTILCLASQSTRTYSTFAEKRNYESVAGKRIEFAQANRISNNSLNRSTKLSRSDVTNDIIECKDIKNLFHLIERQLLDLTPEILELFYIQINYIYTKAKKKSISNFRNDNQDALIQTIQRSHVFNKMLNRTTHLVDELSPLCLSKAYKVFKLVKLKEDDQAMRSLYDTLFAKIDQLEPEQLCELALILSVTKKDDQSTEMDINVRELVLNKIKSIIINDELFNDIKSIIGFLNVFLSSNSHSDYQIDYKMTYRLFQMLQSPAIKLDFKSAVSLLDLIQNKKIAFYQSIDSALPINELVKKCNAAICEELTNNPTQDNASFYCNKLFDFISEIVPNIENLHDQKVLELISAILIRTIDEHPSSKFLLMRLIYIHSKSGISDEKSMECLYKQICKDELFRNKLRIPVNFLFDFFAEFNFPFIDYQHLADILFDEHQFRKFSKLKLFNLLRCFCNLVLNDVRIEGKLFEQFNRLITTKLNSSDLSRESVKNEVNRLILSKIYLTLSENMDSNCKSMIEREMNEWITIIQKNIGSISLRYTYFRMNDKLQIDSHLSNNLYIGTFGIFDKHIQNLIPLTGYEDYFNQVDLIPLDEHQQIIRFAKIPRLKGNVNCQYNNVLHSRMEQILGDFYNIKQINVYKDDLLPLDLKAEIEFLNKLAIDSYVSNPV